MRLSIIKRIKSISGKGTEPYIKNVLTLSLGTLIAQIAMAAAAPLLTRLYTPGELGMNTLVMTIAAIAGPLVNGRYDMSVVSASNDKEAEAALKASLLVCILSLILSVLITTCILLVIPEFLGNIGLRIFFVIPLLALFGLTNSITSYNNRYREYKLIASVSAVKSVVLGAGQSLFGLFRAGVDGLLTSQVVSMVVSQTYQLKRTKIDIKSIMAVKMQDLNFVLKKFKNQPLFSTPALLLSTLSYSVIPFIINGLYSIKEVGYYSIAFTMLGIPIQLFSVNIAKVFFKKASEEKQEMGVFYKTFKDTLIILLVISIPVFLFLMFYATGIFRTVFGQNWSRAGRFVEILSPMYAFRFISASLIPGLIIGNRQRMELVIQSILFLQAVFAMFLAKSMNCSIEEFLTTISILFTISYLISIISVFVASKDSKSTVL